MEEPTAAVGTPPVLNKFACVVKVKPDGTVNDAEKPFLSDDGDAEGPDDNGGGDVETANAVEMSPRGS